MAPSSGFREARADDNDRMLRWFGGAGGGSTLSEADGSFEVKPGSAGYSDSISHDSALHSSAASAELADPKCLLAGAFSPEWRQSAMDRPRRRVLIDARRRREKPAHIICIVTEPVSAAGCGNDCSADAKIEFHHGGEIGIEVLYLLCVIEDDEHIAYRAQNFAIFETQCR
jgi:hypothetical protein